MAYSRVVAQQATCTIADGGAFSSAGPTWGNAVPVTAFIKEARISDKINTADPRGWGDTLQRLHPTYEAGDLTLELNTEDTGFITVTKGGFGQVVIQEGPNATPGTYTGLWTQTDKVITLDSPTTQTLMLSVGADYA